MIAIAVEAAAEMAAIVGLVLVGWLLLLGYVRRQRSYLVAPDDLASQCAPDPVVAHARSAGIPDRSVRMERGDHLERVIAQDLESSGLDWHMAQAVAPLCRHTLDREGFLDEYYARPYATEES